MAYPELYPGWITYVRNWIGADDYSDEQVASFLDLGQTQLNTDLNSFPMEKSFEHVVVAPANVPIVLATIIPDFGKIRLVVVRGYPPLDVAAFNEYQTKAQDLTNSDYMPKIYSIDAGKLYIWPWPAEGAIVDIYYYEKVPLLSPTVNSNTFSRSHPDLLLYAASLEAAAYMVEDERVPVWQSKYVVGVTINNDASTKIKLGSTPLLRKIVGMSPP